MLTVIQSHLEAIYQIQAPDITPFLLSEDQLASLHATSRGADEWVLMRESEGGLDLGVYISAARLAELSAAATPAAAVDRFFGAYCAATEGVSHFLMLVERAERGEPVSLLELEVQAEVDKFVTAWLHRRTDRQRIHRRLFEEARLRPDLSPEERGRYREAGRLGAAVCRWLGTAPDVGGLLSRARHWRREAGWRRLERARSLATWGG